MFLSSIIPEINELTVIILPTLILCDQYISICTNAKLPYTALNSNVEESEKKLLVEECLNDLKKFCEKYNIIITTPDTFIGDDCRIIVSTLYEENLLKRIVVDEAHLTFDHGLTFRPNYIKLLTYFITINKTQFIFCSGSLIIKAITKISKICHIKNYNTLRGSCFKSNIIIIHIRKETLIDLSNYINGIKRLQIIRKNYFKEKPFEVLVIVRSLKKVKECTTIFKKNGYSVTTYNSTLTKYEKKNLEINMNQIIILLL
ncbi:DNA/RNA helicase, DEAD/DEAH box type, N-terminal domain and Helicase, superfamily 1/2, ATP-binding domain and P-loop containing nucleoside triphosphate hydrolase domain-containing protein [Strongyloides ratti]|uniref:DNA/RNA helicase, DEAD/DEAH box type, N-terminal domain and Helicase, superfamily 1/2, ATP-binding domain and P-loop containing nucleoside triphosphate hydrolase domain-containing protein n=1 Tax=Strongyloides ratti TaxID=34506 RepID=A0A090KT96_STRRB|nr:DNA/RNA helicase, DEAD/DEAH box type, N-terminal domain and Helicase, superfamily 1/2, ATP-binding domain and P-loop containing nucleoside triphosphate hydrolase domain-containing protein [Strongyloides ratti]CEF60631.1 DNA/RNA helicase, DEAD/DEAH box type, N-terminal domain and Helicase, superfamily 1/2, ATP-binding domain and P-loop containing nucleoside triphosphate hydrolase domain-containing protein [Strongyloides ratti]